MRTYETLAQLEADVGRELGPTPWFTLAQLDIDAFAATTRDDFWLHTDPARATAGPFGTTIAHGLLTLSLEPMFRYQLVTFAGWPSQVNAGYDRVRFPAPVPRDSRLRMRSEVARVEPRAGGVEVGLHQTIERDGSERPVCVADAVLRLLDA